MSWSLFLEKITGIIELIYPILEVDCWIIGHTFCLRRVWERPGSCGPALRSFLFGKNRVYSFI
jgi:hypothetical protein